MRHLRFSFILVFVGAALLLVGCGTQRAPSGATARPGAAATSSEVATSPSWAAEGQRLRQYKKEQNAELSPGAPRPADAADFAYQSQPVNITGNGKYILYFGPVDASFNYPQSPSGVTFDFPADANFRVLASGPVQMATINGQSYLEVGVTVSDFTAPYSQFTGWIY